MLPYKVYDSLSGHVAHRLLVNGQDLISWKKPAKGGAVCRWHRTRSQKCELVYTRDNDLCHQQVNLLSNYTHTHTHKFCTRQGCQTIKVFNLINHSVGSDYSRLIMVDWGKSTFLNMTKNKYVYWCKRKRNNLKWSLHRDDISSLWCLIEKKNFPTVCLNVTL